MRNSDRHADVCLECLGKCDWYAFLDTTEVVIRKILNRKSPQGNGTRSCYLYASDARRGFASPVYVHTPDGLRSLFANVKSIPKKCERYCEHFIAGSIEDA